jgi:polysaccharide biosynthesis transport protein
MTSTRSTLLAISSPLSMMKAVWNHKRLCLVLWFLLTCGGIFVIRRLPAVYRAETVILVESQRIPERYVSATVTPDLQDRLNVLSEQVLSDTRLTAMIDAYGLYRKEGRHLVHDEILTKMRSDITIKPEKAVSGRSTAFRISYQGGNPRIVAQVANQIGSFFIDENLRQRETEAAGTSEFLEGQLAEAKKRLEEQEAMLSQYKLSHSGELPEQENALLSSVGQVKVQLAGVQDALNRAQQNKIMLDASLTSAQTTATAFLQTWNTRPAAQEPSDPLVAAAAGVAAAPQAPDSERLAEELSALEIRYGPEHPEVRRVKALLQRAREAEKREAAANPQPSGTAPAGAKLPEVSRPVRQLPPEVAQSLVANRERIESLKVQIAAADREISGLNIERLKIQQNLDGLQGHIEKLPMREQQLAAVTRDYETTKAAYQSLLDKKLAADVAADMEKRQKAERFVLLEAAHVPEKPIKPKRQLLAGGGCLFSLALSMALAVGLEFRKGVFLGEWELPHSVTVLGRVPTISPNPFGGARIRRFLTVVFGAVILAAGTGAGVYLGWMKL